MMLILMTGALLGNSSAYNSGYYSLGSFRNATWKCNSLGI